MLACRCYSAVLAGKLFAASFAENAAASRFFSTAEHAQYSVRVY